jgi:large subunit ribosomal protein L25
MTLLIEGAEEGVSPPTVMIKEVQRNLAPRELISIDFRRTSMEERVHATVPVIHIGESPGVKHGGILEHIVREIPVECLPADIPDHLEADVAQLEIGESFRVRELAAPEGVTILAPEDEVVVLVAPPVTVEEVAPEAPPEEGAVVPEVEQPEVIGEGEPEGDSP